MAHQHRTHSLIIWRADHRCIPPLKRRITRTVAYIISIYIDAISEFIFASPYPAGLDCRNNIRTYVFTAGVKTLITRIKNSSEMQTYQFTRLQIAISDLSELLSGTKQFVKQLMKKRDWSGIFNLCILA